MIFEFSPELIEAELSALEKCKEQFEKLDRLCEQNGEKVLKAFIDNRISEMHLKGTTGYGYDDGGRDKLDAVFAQVLGAEDALVRHNFVNGTHAIVTALFGVLRAGDKILFTTSKPYDTVCDAVFGENIGSLKDYGITAEVVELTEQGMPDLEKIAERAKGCKAAFIQRSRGYSLRPSYDIETIETIISAVKKNNPDCIVIVDNCYGELVEDKEPTAVGADLIIGSLIKNLGGGIAETGGYIAGRADLIEKCAYRLTTPGAGKEVGCTLNQLRGMYMGLFRAPEAVCGALKTSVFATALFDELGYEAFPKYDEKRTDIIAAIKLNGAKELCAFCEGIQSGSPIDSGVTPEPWDMPGYDSKVIMAAGAFTMGASIEISADAPLREPYAVWVQGGLTFASGKIAIMKAAERVLRDREND